MPLVAGDSAWQRGLHLQLGYGEISGARFATHGNLMVGLSLNYSRARHEWFTDIETGTWSVFRHRGTTQLDYRVKVYSLRVGYRHRWKWLRVSGHGGYARYTEDATSNDVFGEERYDANHLGSMVGLGLGTRLTNRWGLRADYDFFLGGEGSNDAPWPLASQSFSSLTVKLQWRLGRSPS